MPLVRTIMANDALSFSLTVGDETHTVALVVRRCCPRSARVAVVAAEAVDIHHFRDGKSVIDGHPLIAFADEPENEGAAEGFANP